jgi:O-antigen/teichoic acid export membrane protein
MFVMSPVIVKTLGNRDYGIWEIIMSIVGYMGLLDMGIGPALLRYVAVSHSDEDREQLQQVISTSLAFFVAIGCIAVAILLGLSRYPSLIAGGESVNVEYLTTVLLLFALNAAIVFPLNVFVATLFGVQRHYLVNSARIIFGVIRAFIAYYLLLTYPAKGLMMLALLEPVFNLLQFGVYAVALQNDSSIPGFSLSACSFQKMKELLAYGSKSATLMIASRIQSTSLPFVISAVLGVSNVIYFTMPNRLIDYAKGFSLAMGLPLTPYFASQMAGDDRVAVRTSWLQTTLAFQIITMAMPLVILFCGERFLTVWIGKEYGVAGKGVLYCLVAALFVESVAPNASKILLASGHHGRAALHWLGLAIMSVPVAVLGAYRWGVTGVALGSSAALIVGNIVMLKMACADVGVSFTEYLNQTACRLLVPLMLLAFCLWASGLIFSAESYLHLVLQITGSGVIYLISVWFLTLSFDNRIRLADKIESSLTGGK